jgi:hypothetical protein
MMTLYKLKLINDINIIDDIKLIIKNLYINIEDITLNENLFNECKKNNMLLSINMIIPPTIDEWKNGFIIRKLNLDGVMNMNTLKIISLLLK